MEKINCNVIQDILPLYIEDAVSEDTKELVEEHLQNCEICQRVYHETKDTWFGVTYQEDKEAVMEAFKNLTDAGVYPQGLYK